LSVDFVGVGIHPKEGDVVTDTSPVDIDRGLHDTSLYESDHSCRDILEYNLSKSNMFMNQDEPDEILITVFTKLGGFLV
jgi:hypothetical protein